MSITASDLTEATASDRATALGSTETERRDALAQRLFEATIDALELFSIHIGRRLGLYETLAGSAPLTSGEFAAKTGIDERYAREWLEQQAVAGFLDVDDPTAGPDRRRFSLPPGHVTVLADPEDPAHVAPFAPMVVGIAGALPAVIEAYRTGSGVPYSCYGADFRDGQGAINRPSFTGGLAGWLRSVPELDARLTSDPPARVADVGCGLGWSTLAIARAYPGVMVDGFDLDEASICDAALRTADPEVAGRLSFAVRDADRLPESGPYDLVCLFEVLHDMARPVDALTAARKALAPGGSVLVVDERVAEMFTAPADQVERVMYGWSVVHCLPASRAEQPSAALGTALRAGTVGRLAAAAGFSRIDELEIDNDFFRFYRLCP